MTEFKPNITAMTIYDCQHRKQIKLNLKINFTSHHLNFGSGISFKADIMVILPQLFATNLFIIWGVYYMKMRLVLRWERLYIVHPDI
jgi:hypothetical protein